MAAKKDDFLKEFMSFKNDWDKDVKERGTDLESLATSAQTKQKSRPPTAKKANNFAPPSGTARLTEKNLKRMEQVQAKIDRTQLAGEKASKFSKDSRFKAAEQDDKQLLYPSIDFARQTYHASKTAIKPKTKMNERFNDNVSQTVSTAATSAIEEKNKKDRYSSSPSKGVTIAKISNLSDDQLERLLRAQFRRNVKQFTDKVISSSVNYSVIEKNVRGTVMKPKANESRLRIEKEWQERRAPTMMTYAPKDEVTRPNMPGGIFPQEERGESSPKGDFRRPLDPNLDAIKKVAPKVSIAPEHEAVESEMIKEWIQSKNGPGNQYPKYKLVEPRTDVGVPKIRSDYFQKIEEKDEQGDLNPNFNFTKPNKLVFKYFQPTEQKPPNMPMGEANPGRWVFYDVDLDAVRAELAQNIYLGAKDETKEEFAEREEFQRLLEEHIKRKQKRIPEHGDYDKPHTENEIPGANVDFSKQIGREGPQDPDEVDELEGDVLILDPEKLQKRLPDIKFERQLGREEHQIDEQDDKEGDVLDLEPRKLDKHVADINFEKQVGRPEPIELDDDDDFIHDLGDEPIPKDPSVPKVIAHNFGLAGDRFDHEKDRLNQDLDLVQDEVALDPQLPERKLKGTVFMDRGEERFKERRNSDPFYEDQPLNELDNDVHVAIDKATKPHVAVPDFNRFTNGGKEKRIVDVKQEEETKQKKQSSNLTKAKTTYDVKKIFTGNATAKKKKAAAKKKQPKEALESAQDEVERYLKELGFD